VGAIRVERDDRSVATVWLDNPPRRNALGDAMIVALCEALRGLADDDACRAIVLRGRGGVFCAGRDLADLSALQQAPPGEVAKVYGTLQALNEAVYFSPHPVIAVVERYALGIATMLVSWSDIALSEEGAMFGYPEVHHGITPYGAVPTMLNTMNQKAMLDLLLTGRRIDASEALRLGILTRVAPAERLEAELDDVVAHILRGSPAAIRRSKAFVRECETLGYRQGIDAATEKAIGVLGSPEMRSGLAAFLGKRDADWS
jgi:enoyl-CoA hydratase/carnithine racemase